MTEGDKQSSNPVVRVARVAYKSLRGLRSGSGSHDLPTLAEEALNGSAEESKVFSEHISNNGFPEHIDPAASSSSTDTRSAAVSAEQWSDIKTLPNAMPTSTYHRHSLEIIPERHTAELSSYRQLRLPSEIPERRSLDSQLDSAQAVAGPIARVGRLDMLMHSNMEQARMEDASMLHPDRQELKKHSSSYHEPNMLKMIDALLAGCVPSREELLKTREHLAREPQHRLTDGGDDWVKNSLMQMVMSKVTEEGAAVRSLPRGTTPASCLPASVRMILARASCGWSIPAWDLDKATNGRPLSTLLNWLCDEIGLFDELGLDPMAMRLFALHVERAYLDPPYHNRRHATTVLFTMGQIIMNGGMLKEAGNSKVGDTPMKLYIFAALLAAAVHDVAHRGVTNDYLVRTGDVLALRYHDVSVNENHHLAQAFALMRETKALAGLSLAAQRVVRSVIIDLVLKTDMRVHFDVLAKFRSVTTKEGVQPEEQLVSTLAFMLKCADLGHSCFPWQEHIDWFRCLEEEYHSQGDLEKGLQITMSPLTSREKSMGKTQAKFFEVLVLPMYELLTEVFPATAGLLEGAQSNHAKWVANRGELPLLTAADRRRHTDRILMTGTPPSHPRRQRSSAAADLGTGAIQS